VLSGAKIGVKAPQTFWMFRLTLTGQLLFVSEIGLIELFPACVQLTQTFKLS